MLAAFDLRTRLTDSHPLAYLWSTYGQRLLFGHRNDRHNYMLTTKHWAESLGRHLDAIVGRWGERLYRRFRLYLWGCVHSFSIDEVTAYRLLLELPADSLAAV